MIFLVNKKIESMIIEISVVIFKLLKKIVVVCCVLCVVIIILYGIV